MDLRRFDSERLRKKKKLIIDELLPYVNLNPNVRYDAVLFDCSQNPHVHANPIDLRGFDSERLRKKKKLIIDELLLFW